MRECGRCGQENSGKARYCNGCGFLLVSALADGTALDGGRYLIESLVKQGGMGSVYRARDLRLSRDVALKEMLDLLYQTPEERETAGDRFQHEAQMLAGLAHPNLPRVTDFFNEGGRHYLAMDFIEGVDLETYLHGWAAKGLSEGLACRWGAVLADVLDYLHGQDPPVIYRDLKPSNIMVRPGAGGFPATGDLALVDFGIARRIYTDTGSRTAVGTEGYAPLEQYQGRLDPRSDIYALGATLYHLLTAKVPTPFRFLPIRHERADVSETLQAILAKCLSLEPEGRFASAALLRDSLLQRAKMREVQRTKTQPAKASGGRPGAGPEAIGGAGSPEEEPRLQPTGRDPMAEPGAETAPGEKPRMPDGWTPTPLQLPTALPVGSSGAGLFTAPSAESAPPARLDTIRAEPVYARVEATGSAAASAVGQAAPDLPLPLSRTRPAPPRPGPARPEPVVPAALVVRRGPTGDPRDSGHLAGTELGPRDLSSAAGRAESARPAAHGHKGVAEPRSLSPVLTWRDSSSMALVPAGDFWMGSGEADPAAEQDELPQRLVHVDAFYIDRTPVTHLHFERFVRETGYVTQAERRGSPRTWRNPTGRGWSYGKGGSGRPQNLDSHPVVCVSWEDAQAYCMWAGKRLPSEAEWEKAARGRDARLYPWGNFWDAERANNRDVTREELLGRMARIFANRGTLAVGCFPNGTSPYGILDMAGNVCEWVQDAWRPYPGGPPPSEPASERHRVIRGGSWWDSDPAAALRCARRTRALKDADQPYVGFRCVVDARHA